MRADRDELRLLVDQVPPVGGTDGEVTALQRAEAGGGHWMGAIRGRGAEQAAGLLLEHDQPVAVGEPCRGRSLGRVLRVSQSHSGERRGGDCAGGHARDRGPGRGPLGVAVLGLGIDRREGPNLPLRGRLCGGSPRSRMADTLSA